MNNDLNDSTMEVNQQEQKQRQERKKPQGQFPALLESNHDLFVLADVDVDGKDVSCHDWGSETKLMFRIFNALTKLANVKNVSLTKTNSRHIRITVDITVANSATEENKTNNLITTCFVPNFLFEKN